MPGVFDFAKTTVLGRVGQSAVQAGLGSLTSAADRDQITIYGTAAHPKLIEVYTADLPGLVDVGRGWPRSRKLRRSPQLP